MASRQSCMNEAGVVMLSINSLAYKVRQSCPIRPIPLNAYIYYAQYTPSWQRRATLPLRITLIAAINNVWTHIPICAYLDCTQLMIAAIWVPFTYVLPKVHPLATQLTNGLMLSPPALRQLSHNGLHGCVLIDQHRLVLFTQ
jgi:hypothetical protein